MNIDEKAQLEMGDAALGRMLEILRMHSVGIVARSENIRTAPLLGSGTLVIIGGEKGIITAGHVYEAIKNFQPVSLVFVSKNNDDYRNVHVDIDNCAPFVLGKKPWENGPDLCFLKLPYDVVSVIDCHGAVFKNIDLDKKKMPLNAQSIFMFFVGGFADFYTKEISDDGKESKEITFVHETGVVQYETYRNSVTDTMVRHPREDRLEPDSFGGVSGAGVWGLSIDKDMNMRHLFFGVVCRETESSHDIRHFIFNGYISVYRDLFAMLGCLPT